MAKIKSVTYQMLWGEGYCVKDAQPLEGREKGFSYKVSHDQEHNMDVVEFIFTPCQQALAKAQAKVAPFLDSWAAWASLERDPGVLGFKYLACVLIQEMDESGAASANITLGGHATENER